MSVEALRRGQPHCVSVSQVFVGEPSVQVVPARGWRVAAWNGGAPLVGAGLPARTAGRAGGTALFRRRAVDTCLQTIADLRLRREPRREAHWRTPADVERRLLAQVHALLGLGPDALMQVQAMLLSPVHRNPGRVFAALLVLGSAAESRWLPAIRDLFVAAVLRHPQDGAAAVEALCLAPQPRVGEALAPLLKDPQPVLQAAVMRVLAYRNELPVEDWSRALRQPRRGLILAALSAHPQRYDRELWDESLPIALATGDEGVVRACLRVGAALRLPGLHAQALRLATRDPLWADALMALALHGQPEDAPWLRDRLRHGDRWPAARAAAVLGVPTLVPDLLALLETADGQPTAQALLQTSLGQLLGEGPRSASGWRAHWARCEPAASAGALRLRQGQPWQTSVLLAQLSGHRWQRAERQDLYLELIAAGRGVIPRFSTGDFVGVQQRALLEAAQLLSLPPALALGPGADALDLELTAIEPARDQVPA